MTPVYAAERPKGHETLCPVLESHGVLCYWCRVYEDTMRDLKAKQRRGIRKREAAAQMTLDELLSRELHGDKG